MTEVGSPSPVIGTLEVLQDTVFKRESTLPSGQLPDDEKMSIPKGTLLPVVATLAQPHDHVKVSFDRQIGRYNTWFVWFGGDHVRLEGTQRAPIRMTDEGFGVLKAVEGFQADAYLCPAGWPTIGYGFTREVKLGDHMTRQEADRRLREEVGIYEDGVNRIIEVPVSRHQGTALVLLAYNIGLAAFASSTVAKRVNETGLRTNHDIRLAADALTWWNKIGADVSEGLVRRRAWEYQIFVDGKYDFDW